jgi:hypothetical protein
MPNVSNNGAPIADMAPYLIPELGHNELIMKENNFYSGNKKGEIV